MLRSCLLNKLKSNLVIFSFVYLFINQNNSSLVDPESPVIFARSFLLEESTNTMFACNTEVKKYETVMLNHTICKFFLLMHL